MVPGRRVWCWEDLPWPSRRLSRVSPAPSAFRRTSEPLEGPPCPPLRGLLAARASTHWASEGLWGRGLGLGRHRRAPHLPTMCPSVLHKARQRAGEIADISGPWAIYQEETEWDTRSFLPTFHTAVTAGSTPGPRWHRGHQTNHKGRSSRVSEEQHSQCFPQKYPKIFNFPVIWFLIFWSGSSHKQFFLKMFMFLLSTISLFKDTASTYKNYITEPEEKQSWKHNQIRRNYCQWLVISQLSCKNIVSPLFYRNQWTEDFIHLYSFVL